MNFNSIYDVYQYFWQQNIRCCYVEQKLKNQNTKQLTKDATIVFENGYVNEINFSQNFHFHDLPIELFDVFPGLKSLHIQRSPLLSHVDWNFESEILKSLTNLEYLTIENVKISSLTKGFFVSQLRLKNLRLVNNSISSIREGCFNNMELTSVHISGNHQCKTDFNFLEGLNNLELLDFINNNISSISEINFVHVPNLIGINLASNHISEVNANHFQNFEELRVLFLYDNPLRFFPYVKFTNLLSLELPPITHVDAKLRALVRISSAKLSINKQTYRTNNFFGNFSPLKLRKYDIEQKILDCKYLNN